MTNYYDILGVKATATSSEIKTAFRILAKLYHPDLNPTGQEEFKKILRAYETLINPGRKSSYDLKLKYHQTSAHANQHSKTKHWSFDEKELKRRQYYNEHIKKYEKVKKTKQEHANLKKNYNEYKYILYATPIAVLLFLLVINFATPSHKTLPEKNTEGKNSELKMGDEPYRDYFGAGRHTIENGKTLSIKNNSASDIIVCLFSQNSFVRSCFIKDNFYAQIPQLPVTPVEIRYQAGANWDPAKQPADIQVQGLFTKDVLFYKTDSLVSLGPLNEITLLPGINAGFKIITPKEFFNKENL